MPLLELELLSAGYSQNPVLKDVTMTLDRGEIITLLGANGAGKSTLLKSISGLMRPQGGRILYDGEDIGRLPPDGRLRCGIAHVPEGRQIFQGMTVRENLELGAFSARGPADKRQLEFVLRLFPVLEPRLDHVAGHFSGGQQQMLAIARGLMSRPKLVLLDEPSLGIAPLLVVQIFKLVADLRNEGITILLAEQNARQALSIADRGYVMENGRITLTGAAKDLASSPEVAERYLGMAGGEHLSGPVIAALASRMQATLASKV
jgi:branched-chain amino acid transport system ATP-binding protein